VKLFHTAVSIQLTDDCYRCDMSRSALAFVVAPLWVPLFVIPYSCLSLFSGPGQGPWIIIAAFLSIIFAYGGTLVFGLPAFLILRSRNLTALWIAAVLGFVIGATTWVLFMAFFALWLGGDAQAARRAAQGTFMDQPMSLVWTGLLGVVVGTTLWLIARPDRGQSS
jgi:hypothetical protein